MCPLLSLPEYLSSSPVCREVRVTRSLVLCVCFVDSCLFFFFWPLCCLFFDLGFWLPLWYLNSYVSSISLTFENPNISLIFISTMSKYSSTMNSWEISASMTTRAFTLRRDVFLKVLRIRYQGCNRVGCSFHVNNVLGYYIRPITTHIHRNVVLRINFPASSLAGVVRTNIASFCEK